MRIVVMFYEMLLISKQHFQFKSVQFCGKSYFIIGWRTLKVRAYLLKVTES